MHVRIISPSGAIDPQYILQASSLMQSWGWQVSQGDFACSRVGRFAGTAGQRLGDLHNALSDSNVDVVLCARGGYGLQQIIDALHVDKDTLPLLVGFSDITVLHQWYALKHLPSLHADMCKGLSTTEDATLWKKAVEGETLHYDLPAHLLNRQGEVEGRLIGGNLSVLYGLQGTPFSLQQVITGMPNDDKPILFIEDIAERHYHIDRMMRNLKMSGILEQIGGMVVGEWTDCEDDPLMGCTVEETIRQAVQEYPYPVLFGFPAGHGDKNLPLRLGSNCSLHINEQGARLVC